MGNFEKTFSDAICKIQGNGTYCMQDELNYIPPGLHIDGIGEIGLPLGIETAKKIIGVSQQSPFEKGRKTIVDETVKNTWELDPQSFKLENPDWKTIISKIPKLVQEGLGLEDSK